MFGRGKSEGAELANGSTLGRTDDRGRGLDEVSEQILTARDAIEDALMPILRGMVNHASDLKTTVTVSTTMVIATIYAHQDDVGYLIGRRGQNANALRTLMTAIAGKHGCACVVEIVG